MKTIRPWQFQFGLTYIGRFIMAIFLHITTTYLVLDRIP
jgi:hypothetical protein